MDGKDTRDVNVMGFDPQDTEALSLGPCPGGGSCLYLGDIGDNDSKRKAIEIVIVDEVQNFPKTVKARARLKLQYPDGPHDAESMAVQPQRRHLHPDQGTARAFVQSGRPQGGANPGDGDNARSGKQAHRYGHLRRWNPAAGPDLHGCGRVQYGFEAAAQDRAGVLQQQESITYLPGSQSFIYTTERLLAILPQWMMRADCAGQ